MTSQSFGAWLIDQRFNGTDPLSILAGMVYTDGDWPIAGDGTPEQELEAMTAFARVSRPTMPNGLMTVVVLTAAYDLYNALSTFVALAEVVTYMPSVPQFSRNIIGDDLDARVRDDLAGGQF